MTTETKVITAMQKVAKSITTSATGLTKVTTDLQALVDVAEDLGQDIAQKQATIAGLDKELDDNQRIAAANLKIRVLEDEDKVFNELRTQRQVANITNAQLNDLQDNLEAATADNKAEVDKAVAIATSTVKRAGDAALVQVKAEQSVETATYKADIASLRNEKVFLENTIADLKAMIEAERDTRLGVAQAEAGQQTIINTTTK